MVRNKILFSGQSNTFGLGLEVEFRPKYNDDEWLKENGLILPLPREPEDVYYWKKYRWTGLVCKELGYEEINIHDIENIPIGGNGIQTCWMLQNKNFFSDLMDGVKYVIFEMSGIRWYDDDLHGKNDKYPNTVREMINVLENQPEVDTSDWNDWLQIQSDTFNWLFELDIDAYDKEMTDRFKNLQSLYPNSTFLILVWNSFQTDPSLGGDVIELGESVNCVHQWLTEKKLCLYQTQKVFNGDYEYAYKDEHPTSEGHKWVASKIIEHIRNLENNKKGSQ